MAGVVPMKQESSQEAQQTVADKKKLDWLKTHFQEAENARLPYEGTWLLNMAFFEGNQWLQWDGNRLSQPKLRADRILITDNRIQPAVRTEVAKMTKERPAWDNTPDSSDEDAVNGARFGERVVDSKWDTMHLQPKLRRALEWSRVCSAGFWKVTWDSSLGKGRQIIVGQDGKVVRHPETEQPLDPKMLDALPEEARAQLGTVKRVHQGDARIDVRSPFQIYPDPLADGLDECEHIFEKSIVSPTYLLGRYGVKLEPDSESDGSLVQARLSRPGRSSSSVPAKRGVLVYEFWQKGNAVNPDGRHVVWARDKILVDEANPYVDDDMRSVLPYVMFPGITIPGRFWPTSIVEQLRPIQVELNKVKSQIAENRNRIGNPSLLISKQANVKYHGVPGERVEYDDTTQNAVPTYLQPPEMPGYVQNEIGAMVDSIMEISGQHEISSGTVPTGVTAAAAISLLQQQDDTKLGPPIDDMNTALSQAGQMLLRLIAQYYSDERLVRIAGEDGKFEAFSFKGAMLKGQVGGLKVREGSTMPKSQAAKRAAMQDMFGLMVQYGIRFDERALRTFFKDWEVGGLEALLGDLDADERKVNRENRRMYAGVPVQVDPMVDNHDAEIAAHREEMKSPEFEIAPDVVKQIFHQHLKDHLDAQAQAQAAQMQAMAAQDPNAAPPPGAGGGQVDALTQMLAAQGGGGTGPNAPVPVGA